MISESMNDGVAETLQAGEANMNLEYAASQWNKIIFLPQWQGSYIMNLPMNGQLVPQEWCHARGFVLAPAVGR